MLVRTATRLRCRMFVLAAALLLGAGALHAAPRVQVSANDAAFEATAKQVGKGGRLTVDGFLLEGDSATSTLELERFEVWRPGAVVLVDGKRVPPPATAYFRGSVVGYPGSAALVAVRADGGTMGLVLREDGAWAIGKGRGQGALRSRKARTEAASEPFACGLDELTGGSSDPLALETSSEPSFAATTLDQPYVATLALETDYELYARFGNQQAALDYLGDLVAYGDIVYSREIDTDLAIGFARLWTGGADSDPWTVTSGTSQAITELRNYWNSNMTAVERTMTHMLSGKNLGGGVAWLGVLCDNYNRPGSSYDYGLSGSVTGSFDWDGDPSQDPAAVVWDLMVVLHEIGHNFNSPHSHDYCDTGGSAQPIDSCYAGCAGAATGLPSCSAPTPYFGGGAGTIMSYCHTQAGGFANVAMTFGEGHTCGTMPDREADRMSSHVAFRASLFPGCFVSQTCGNGQLDLGEACDGTLFADGATCESNGFVGGTLACSASCTLDTSQCTTCGNDTIDPGEVCDGTDLGGASCSDEGCAGGILMCNATCSDFDRSLCDGCTQCNGNGICEAGEDCGGCPSDCPSGTTSGAVCGNGICEAGNGEDCLSCPSDCNGVQGGKPAGRFCCGDGDGTNPIDCSDSRCTANGNSCTTIATASGSYCCGDTSCDVGEDCSVCAQDCALGFEVCDNGIDDDCNGFADCADSACTGDPACSVASCGAKGDSCTGGGDCCSGNCKIRGKSSSGTCN